MANASKSTVAVIDDDARVRQSLENLLDSAGYRVRSYPSGDEFLKAGGYSDIDCLISDIGMPGIDGLELQRRLLGIRADLPVILITGRYEMDTPGMSTPNNHGCFKKPVDANELLRALAAAAGEVR
jgi:FixJ family two-component response regulator